MSPPILLILKDKKTKELTNFSLNFNDEGVKSNKRKGRSRISRKGEYASKEIKKCNEIQPTYLFDNAVSYYEKERRVVWTRWTAKHHGFILAI